MKLRETHCEDINWIELAQVRTWRWAFVTMGLNIGFTEIGKVSPNRITVNSSFEEFLLGS
jgi:hypothetical protein